MLLIPSQLNILKKWAWLTFDQRIGEAAIFRCGKMIFWSADLVTRDQQTRQISTQVTNEVSFFNHHHHMRLIICLILERIAQFLSHIYDTLSFAWSWQRGENVFGARAQADSCPHQPPSPYQCRINKYTKTTKILSKKPLRTCYTMQ